MALFPLKATLNPSCPIDALLNVLTGSPQKCSLFLLIPKLISRNSSSPRPQSDTPLSGVYDVRHHPPLLHQVHDDFLAILVIPTDVQSHLFQVFGDQVAAASDHDCPVDHPRGKKRKYEEENETCGRQDGNAGDSANSSAVNVGPDVGHRVYVVHRQSVFNISMCKLHRYRQIPDPCLRKSVLICNTLRTIECEMVSEGMELDVAGGASSFLPAIRAADDVILDPLPSPSSLALTPAVVAADSLQQPYSMSPLEPRLGCAVTYDDGSGVAGYEKSLTDLDCAGGRATPRLAPAPVSANDRTADMRRLPSFWNECDDRALSNSCGGSHGGNSGGGGIGTCISWSSVLDFSSQSDVDAVHNGLPEDAWNSEANDCGGCGGESGGNGAASSGPNTSPSASSDSGISTASDEIFGDIDLSLYDFDLLPLSPPSTRVAPPSAEELLHTFADERSRPPMASTRSTTTMASLQRPSGVSSASGHCGTPDYEDDDDHVMHVTVGIQTL